jgi:sugar/nucleoside kinase (ribokinase family)
MPSIDVLVIGRSCLDIIAGVERFPAENQKTPLAFRLMEGGGQGSTSACCISRLGGQVVYVGRLGDDAEGRFCLQRLKDFDVETEHVSVVPGGRTPVAYIFVTRASGARTIFYEPNPLPRMEMTAIIQTLISKASVILLDPETTYLAADIQRCKNDTPKIVYDCERWRKGIEAMMTAADYFIPAAGFLGAEELALDAATLPDRIFQLKSRIGGKLIVTNGEDGAYYLLENRICHVAAPAVDAVDTTGAGDNFHAAFALAVARGLDLTRSVKLATAVASISCGAYGGRNGIPDWNAATATAERLQVRTVASRCASGG